MASMRRHWHADCVPCARAAACWATANLERRGRLGWKFGHPASAEIWIAGPPAQVLSIRATDLPLGAETRESCRRCRYERAWSRSSELRNASVAINATVEL